MRAALLVCLMALVAPRASAEEDRVVAARRAMERGVAAEHSGDLETALAHYERARVLAPEANLPHRHAAEILLALLRYEEAAEAFEAYLRAKPGVKDAPEIRARIERIRSELTKATATVRITSSPPGADVYLDGADVSLGRAPLSIESRAGAHEIVCKKPGFLDGRARAEVSAGLGELSCELEPIAPVQAIQAPAVAAEPESELPWLWIGGGALVIAAGVTAALVLSSGSGFPETRGGEHAFP